MAWYQLRIACVDEPNAEPLSDWMESLGAVSVTFRDAHDTPVLEPAPGATPLWPQVTLEALFTEEAECIRAQLAVRVHYPALETAREILPDTGWETAWMDHFKPMRFGHHLWVCPSSMPAPDENAVNLLLDPGLAFGTGTHPTTALCLTWLDGARLQDCVVTDYGCGSGILAIAALKLGATSANAVDIDPQALDATRDNAARNGIHAARLAVSLPDDLHMPADILIANILLNPLLALRERFMELLAPHGRLVVSGIMQNQARELVSAYARDFRLVESREQDDWALLDFERLPSSGKG